MIQRGYRYKLKPTPAQERLFAQCAGVCRLIYNLALEQRRDHWRAFKRQTGSSISYPSQARELTELRAEYDWIATVSQTCQQQALRDLDRAYQNWFKGIASYPSPRKKGRNNNLAILALLYSDPNGIAKLLCCGTHATGFRMRTPSSMPCLKGFRFPVRSLPTQFGRTIGLR